MFKLTLKSLFDRKIRFALTSLAIVLGVMFSVTVLMLTDSLSDTFDQVAADIEEGVDLTVRQRLEFGDALLRQPVPADVLDDVADIEGVAQVDGRLFAEPVVPFTAEGEAVETFGPPTIGVNFGPSEGQLAQLTLAEGTIPEGPDEFALDIGTVDRDDFVVGETYRVVGPAGGRDFRLSGSFIYGSERTQDTGVVISAFSTETAQEFFSKPGGFDEIGVAVEDPTAIAEVQNRIAEALPDNLEVVNQQVKIEESQDAFAEILTGFRTVLIVFAVIIVIVAAFIINNTFTIVLGQRIRELALLRAIGATGSQVTRSVMAEALIVGVVSTIIGLLAGVGLAVGLRNVLEGLDDFALPIARLELAPATIIAAIFVGVVITLLVSVAPALRARKVPPMAALRDDFQLSGSGLRRRLITGAVVLVAGIALMSLGLFGDLETAPLLLCIGFGSLIVFVGVNLLSPTIARTVSNLAGRRPTGVVLIGLGALQLIGAVVLFVMTVAAFVDGSIGGGIFLFIATAIVAGIGWLFIQAGRASFDRTTSRIARENAARNPRRTASTASALMIGLALVTMASVVGSSLTKTFLSIIDSSVQFDFIVQPDSQSTFTFTPEVYDQVREVDGIDDVVRVRFAENSMRVNGDEKDVAATTFADIQKHIDIDIVAGEIPSDGAGVVLVEDGVAEDNGIQVNDVLTVDFPDGSTEDLTVAALYDDGSIMGNWVVDLTTWDAHFPTLTGDLLLSILQDDGVDPEQLRTDIEAAIANYPVKVEDREEFKDSTRAQINALLIVINVFLLISVVIAALGIANTLALSIFERTRELGLLRAVGMTREQSKRMIRLEAVIVAIFGGLLGVVLGIAFGSAAALAIPDTIINTTSIPIAQIVGYLLAAVLIGLIASLAPARRVARLDVLDAISHG